MTRKEMKVIVIGLDAATLDLIEPWAREGKLSNFANLMEEGSWGVLKSTYPFVTPTAWASFVTGVNPGKHGIFGFTNASPDNPTSLGLPRISHRYMGVPPIWDILCKYGKKVCLVNFPFAFPPTPVNGIMTSGMGTPSVQSEFVYPKELKNEILEKFDFLPDYGAEVYKSKEAFCEIHDRNLEEMLKLSIYMLNKDSWDFYMCVLMEIDHVQHMFWADMDENHPLHDEKNADKYKNKILEYYKKFDNFLGEVIKYVSNDTVLIICSDHGAGPSYKRMALNAWLMREGYLKLKEGGMFKKVLRKILFRAGFDTEKIKRILHKLNLSKYVHSSPIFLRELIPSKETKMWDIDWKNTKAYVIQSYGQICINRSVVSEREYDAVTEEIIRKLYELKDPNTGESIVKRVYKKEDIYSGPHISKAPDIYITLKDETCEIVRFSEDGEIFTSPYLSGTHKENGVFFVYGRGIRKGLKLENASIYDIFPTILHIMGIPIPKYVDGRVLNEIFEEGSELARGRIRYQKQDVKNQIKDKISGQNLRRR